MIQLRQRLIDPSKPAGQAEEGEQYDSPQAVRRLYRRHRFAHLGKGPFRPVASPDTGGPSCPRWTPRPGETSLSLWTPIEQGFRAHAPRAGGVPPLPPLPNPRRIGCAPRREAEP